MSLPPLSRAAKAKKKSIMNLHPPHHQDAMTSLGSAQQWHFHGEKIATS
jgi:hypothetical protein